VAEAAAKRAKFRLSDECTGKFERASGLARTDQSLYGAAAFWDFDVNRSERRNYQGWALILVSATALALSGCGRKGPLDLPPTASAQAPLAAAPGEPVADQPSKPSLFTSSSNSAPPTPKGPKRPFVLDPLLDGN
jgi:predicted small lipoprotein YifL